MKYLPTFARQARKFAELGATQAEIADAFDVSHRTLTSWMNTYPEFNEAVRVGAIPADERAASSLYLRAIGFSKIIEKETLNKDGVTIKLKQEIYFPPDVTAATFWLKNRRRNEWKDRHEVAVTSDFERMSDEELISFIEGEVIELGESATLALPARDEGET